MQHKNPYYVLRVLRDISSKELAQKLEVTQTTISGIEHGRFEPGRRLLRDYAKVLGVEVAFIQAHYPEEDEDFVYYIYRVAKDLID